MIEAVLLVVTLILAVVSICVLFVCLIAACLVWQFGLKLKEFKPRAFILEDVTTGAYKITQGENGDWMLIPSEQDPEGKEEIFDNQEDALEWLYGTIRKTRTSRN